MPVTSGAPVLCSTVIVKNERKTINGNNGSEDGEAADRCAALESRASSRLRKIHKPRGIRRPPISNAGILSRDLHTIGPPSTKRGRPSSHYLLLEQLMVTTSCERFARIREGKSNRMIFVSESRTLLRLYFCDCKIAIFFSPVIHL